MAYAVVQTNNGSTAAATSFTITQSNTTTGNLIVVVVSTITFVVTSVTDSQSNTYTKATSPAANNQNLDIWYAQNITGGTTPTITVNLSGSATGSGIAREYSGMAAAAIDQTVGTTGVAGTPSSGASATTTQANELVVGGMASSTGVPTAGSGYGNFTNNNTQSSGPVSIEDKRVTSTGAQTATFTGGGTIWSVGVATFKEASAAAFIPAKNRPISQAVKRASYY